MRVAEAVESGVEGLLLVLVRYFRTGLIVLVEPRRAELFHGCWLSVAAFRLWLHRGKLVQTKK